MKHSEISQLLASIAATDNRTVGRLDVETWAAILPADMTLADAHQAVVAHRRSSDAWLMPKHIIDAVGAVRRERLTRAGTPPIPGGLTYADEKAWRQLWCSAVKDGDPDPEGVANSAMQIQPQELSENRRRVQAIEALAASKTIGA